MQVFIARISSLYRKKDKVKFNTYRLGVLIVRLRYIGMYPFVTILQCRYLARFLFQGSSERYYTLILGIEYLLMMLRNKVASLSFEVSASLLSKFSSSTDKCSFRLSM